MLEKSFNSAFQNGAGTFARLGIAHFVVISVYFVAYIWDLPAAVRNTTDTDSVRALQNDAVTAILAVGIVGLFLVSAVEFLRRVFRVRKYLAGVGGLRFANWYETLFAFAVPIANFFVPWNRLDVIRATLRTRRRTGVFVVATDPEKKLRTLGILWGCSSLFSASAKTADPVWMSVVLVLQVTLVALSLWMFTIAVRWLSELQEDFEEELASPRNARLPEEEARPAT